MVLDRTHRNHGQIGQAVDGDHFLGTDVDRPGPIRAGQTQGPFQAFVDVEEGPGLFAVAPDFDLAAVRGHGCGTEEAGTAPGRWPARPRTSPGRRSRNGRRPDRRRSAWPARRRWPRRPPGRVGAGPESPPGPSDGRPPPARSTDSPFDGRTCPESAPPAPRSRPQRPAAPPVLPPSRGQEKNPDTDREDSAKIAGRDRPRPHEKIGKYSIIVVFMKSFCTYIK